MVDKKINANQDLVAVVVPVYNNKDTLPYCIDSIISQTYKNLAIILINDGSTDGTDAICEEFALKDKRIKVIHQINHGIGYTRNIGVEAARQSNAKYLSFVDSDDVVDKTYIEKMLSMIYEYNCKIAWTELRWQDISTINNGIEAPKYPYTNRSKRINSKKLLKDENRRVKYSFAWGKLYDISLFDGIKYAEQLYEDGATTFKLIYKAKEIVYNRSALYVILGNPNSITRSSTSLQKIEDGLNSVYIQKEFYKDNGEEYLEKCSYAAIANDLILWYRACDSMDRQKADFDIEGTKKKLSDQLKSHRKNIMKAPNISLLRKIIIELCCRNMKYSKYYIRLTKIYVYKEAVINKIYKLILRG